MCIAIFGWKHSWGWAWMDRSDPTDDRLQRRYSSCFGRSIYFWNLPFASLKGTCMSFLQDFDVESFIRSLLITICVYMCMYVWFFRLLQFQFLYYQKGPLKRRFKWLAMDIRQFPKLWVLCSKHCKCLMLTSMNLWIFDSIHFVNNEQLFLCCSL